MSKERTDTERLDFAERMIVEHSEAGQAFRDGIVALMRDGAVADTLRDLVDVAMGKPRQDEQVERAADDAKPPEWIVTDAYGRPMVSCKSASRAADRFIQFNGIRPSPKRKIIERVVTDRDITKELVP